MKGRLLITGLFLLQVLAACQTPTREARRMVARAEQLADTLPDSTVRLIDSVLRMPVYFSERERIDMALLQAEALFGCRDGVHAVSPVMDDDFFDEHATLSTSPDLERAAAYFAKKKQYAKAAHAALYSGFVQQHYNEKEDAMKSFKEAEKYCWTIQDSLIMAQAQYRMGRMLYDDNMEEDAITLFLKADNNFSNHYPDKALVQNMLSSCYIILSNYEKAETSLNSSLDYAEKAHSTILKVYALNNYAVFYRLQEKYESAIDCLRQAIQTKDFDEAIKLSLYLNLGKTFADQKELDSAAFYFNQIESLLPISDAKEETKISVYSALSRFAESQGDFPKALEYRKQYEKALDKARDIIEQKSAYSIQRKYDHESLQNEMNKKIIKRHVIILIISVLLFVATMIVLVLQYRHKQLLESEKEMRRQMDAMKQDLLQTVKISVLDHEISSRLRTILLAQRTIQRAKDPQNEWQSLVIQIMNKKQDPFEAARSVLETAYPNLYSTILENHPDLTETEAKICLLSCSDLSNAEMAEFLGLRLNTVNQNRSNLRKKLNLKPDGMKEQLRMAFSK